MIAAMVVAAGLLPAALAQRPEGEANSSGQSSSANFPKAPAPPTANVPAANPSSRSTGQPLIGRIIPVNGQLELLAGGISYKLDDQATARKFKGMNVSVTGHLDKATKTVRVEQMREITPK
jgi:hypothetical protein